jgi:hypothetical protein
VPCTVVKQNDFVNDVNGDELCSRVPTAPVRKRTRAQLRIGGELFCASVDEMSVMIIELPK